jgi:membrane protease YdiL (CAAX protease family)
MIVAVAVAGGLAEVAAWALVSVKHVRVWASLAVALLAAGVAALLTGRVSLSPRVSPALAVVVGAGTGLALFGATRAFVAIVSRPWPRFRRDVGVIYGQQGGWSLGATLFAALVVQVGEEVFWRGLVQGRLAAATDRPTGAVLAWLAYVGANLPSANLPIVAGAVVGGAVWAALALWTGGILASVMCHAVWTECMIAFPPREALRDRPTVAST